MTEKICRLCLKMVHIDNFLEIEESSKELLDKMWKPNLDISKEPVICIDCLENLQKSLDFKTTCLYTEDSIVSFLSSENTYKVNLGQIYLKQHGNLMKIPEDHCVCRFCMELKENGCFITLGEAQDHVILFQTMVQKLIPELDLSNTEDPVICEICLRSLQSCFYFMENCLDVEERIKKCCEFQGTDISGQVELDSVLKFSLKNEGLYGADVDQNKEDRWKEICELPEIDQFVKNEDLNICVKNENISIKSEEMKPFMEKYEISTEDIVIKSEESDYNSFTSVIYPEEPIKGNNIIQIVNMTNDTNIYFNTIPILYCVQPEKKPDHRILSTVINKCELCPYQAKNKHTLNQHMIVHKNLSEIKTYKCEICEFVTKRKNTLNRHMLIHKGRSEITMYKCNTCTFETKLKNSLNRHMLIHRDPSEVMRKYEMDPNECFEKRVSSVEGTRLEIVIYKCKVCAYETKFKETLKRHMLVHKSPSEIRMYMCEECLFETKHKGSLRQHMLIHKNPSEIRMFKCNLCTHQTKKKSDFNRHMLIHKNPSELTMFKCDLCSYETKQKRCLSRHMVTHKNKSQLIMYKCENCTFQTKHKRSVIKHMKIHKNTSSIS